MGRSERGNRTLSGLTDQLSRAARGVGTFAWKEFVRPLSLPFLLACLLSTLLSFLPGPFFLLFLLLCAFVFVPWTATLLTLIIVALVRRAWLRFGLRCARFATIAPLVLFGLMSGDHVHLLLLYPHYRAVIDQHPGELVRFPWGDAAATVLDGIQLLFLVYDPSDGGHHASSPGADGDRLRTMRRKHLIGHFYVECDGTC